MFLVVIAWSYVVLLMAVVEATSPTGTLLGAFVTLLLYGVLPLGIVVYLMRTPARARAHRRASGMPSADPHRGSHPPADAVTPEREEA